MKAYKTAYREAHRGFSNPTGGSSPPADGDAITFEGNTDLLNFENDTDIIIFET